MKYLRNSADWFKYGKSALLHEQMACICVSNSQGQSDLHGNPSPSKVRPPHQEKKSFDPEIALCVSAEPKRYVLAVDPRPGSTPATALLQRWIPRELLWRHGMKRRNPAVSLSLKPTHRDIWSPRSKTQTRRRRSLGERDGVCVLLHQWIFIRNDPVHQRHLKSTHRTRPGQIPPPFTLIIYTFISLISGFSTLPSVCLREGHICPLLRSQCF